MSDPILTERDGAILIVTVNRPPANWSPLVSKS